MGQKLGGSEVNLRTNNYTHFTMNSDVVLAYYKPLSAVISLGAGIGMLPRRLTCNAAVMLPKAAASHGDPEAARANPVAISIESPAPATSTGLGLSAGS